MRVKLLLNESKHNVHFIHCSKFMTWWTSSSTIFAGWWIQALLRPFYFVERGELPSPCRFLFYKWFNFNFFFSRAKFIFGKFSEKITVKWWCHQIKFPWNRGTVRLIFWTFWDQFQRDFNSISRLAKAIFWRMKYN